MEMVLHVHTVTVARVNVRLVIKVPIQNVIPPTSVHLELETTDMELVGIIDARVTVMVMVIVIMRVTVITVWIILHMEQEYVVTTAVDYLPVIGDMQTVMAISLMGVRPIFLLPVAHVVVLQRI